MLRGVSGDRGDDILPQPGDELREVVLPGHPAGLRVEYRGDVLQFRLELSPTGVDALAAVWTPTDKMDALAATHA